VAFRERIEAILKVKDAARFKKSMEGAAKSVRGFGTDSTQTAAQTKLLEAILEKLDRQTAATVFAIKALGDAVDDLGDEMVQTAAKAAVMNGVVKKSGSNAVFLGKSWAFWKDRLSLTRSEIITTALTISTYLSPALLALASSLGTALVGGGIVAGGGLISFIAGFVALDSVMKPVVDGVKKITKAQEQYNVTVQQYGAASLQASRSSARLYAVIVENGGWQAYRASQALKRFTDQWARFTAPARATGLGILTDALGAGSAAVPRAAAQVNTMMHALRDGLSSVFNLVRSEEGQGFIDALGSIFSSSIGPGLRGASSVLTIIGRAIKGAAPWIIKWARAWERVTKSWADRASQTAVSKFIDNAMSHFKEWWELGVAVARVLNTIWGSTKEEGKGFVIILTDLVNRFNNWLIKMRDTGQIKAWFQTWKNSVGELLWAIQNPIEAVNKWMPQVMDEIARIFMAAAPAIADQFIQAWLNADGWTRLLTVVAFLIWFTPVFSALGKKMAAVFIVPFLSNFSTAFVAALAVETAAGGRIAAAMTTAGTVSGRWFGRAFAVGMIAAIVLAIPDINDALKDATGAPKSNKKGAWGRAFDLGPVDDFLKDRWDNINPFNQQQGTVRPGGALGGVIPPGGSAFVGERGIEMAHATPTGTEIVPLDRNSLSSIHTVPETGGMANAFHFFLTTSVQLDRREIARAVSDQVAYETARRGGAPKGTGG
jgi:uncharacterized protein YoxC